MNNRCRTCAHVLPREDVVPGVGECRRYPPQPFQEPRPVSKLQPNQMQLVIVAYYPPVVLDREWCSEWAARPIAANDRVAN